MREAEEFLEEECADIDYTIVCPPGLSMEAKTKYKIEVADDMYFILGVPRVMSRADLARYMVHIIDKMDTFQKKQAVGIQIPDVTRPRDMKKMKNKFSEKISPKPLVNEVVL